MSPAERKRNGDRTSRQSRGAGRPRGRIVTHVVVTIAAEHRADTLVVGTTRNPWHVESSRVSLERRIELVAIEAARMLQNRGDLPPRFQAFGTARTRRLAKARAYCQSREGGRYQ